jgi:two-component system response regulator AtoC
VTDREYFDFFIHPSTSNEVCYMRATIYVTDDDQSVCSALSRRLAKKGHLVRSFHSGESLLEAVGYEIPDLLFLDLKMPEMDGLETLRRVRQSIPTTLVVMLTAYGGVEDAVEAMRLGAYDFLIKSVDFSSVEPALNRALNFLTLRRRVEYTASEKQREFSWNHVIAISPSMTSVLERLKCMAAEDTTLAFLHGEVGTGKEFLARVLHYNSQQHLGPFVTVTCTNQNVPRLESQLFGYERGAFSGANQAMPGMFEHADGGTLFIDEIEHLPIPVQERLAEAIRTRSFCRTGGKDRLPINTRLMLASAIPPDHPGNESTFHPALRLLLQNDQIRIPPLRERKEDILPLTLKIIQTYGEEIGRPKIDIDASVTQLLENYKFPGNIRELEALVQKAVLGSQGPILSSQDFQLENSHDVRGNTSQNQVHIQFELGRHSLSEIQGMVIHEVLRLAKQDKEEAARYLHISPQMLEEQM